MASCRFTVAARLRSCRFMGTARSESCLHEAHDNIIGKRGAVSAIWERKEAHPGNACVVCCPAHPGAKWDITTSAEAISFQGVAIMISVIFQPLVGISSTDVDKMH